MQLHVLPMEIVIKSVSDLAFFLLAYLTCILKQLVIKQIVPFVLLLSKSQK